MEYTVCRAEKQDLPRIEEIYGIARRFMEERGNPTQWGKHYPPRNLLTEDIEKGRLFVIRDAHDIHGVFFFWIGDDPTYEVIEGAGWRSGAPYGAIHRIASDGSGGILKTAVAYCREKTGHLRMDTHRNNLVMQNALIRLGFQYRGQINTDDGTPRLAYDYLA